MKKILLSTLISASLISCSEDILQTNYPEFSVIEGDTIKTRTAEFKNFQFRNFEAAPLSMVVGDTIITSTHNLHIPKPSEKVDLSKLKSSDGSFRMIAYGEGFLTGQRDGGYFNEGMLTSLPNLLANQMGVEFKLPLFDKEDYNGFNRRVPTSFNPTGGPVQKYKYISNNTAIEKVDPATKQAILKPLRADRIDNFAIPNGIFVNTSNQIMSRLENAKVLPFDINRDEFLSNIIADFIIIQDVFETEIASANEINPNKIPEFKYHYLKTVYQGSFEKLQIKDFLPTGGGWTAPKLSVESRVKSLAYARDKGSIKKGVILNTPDFYDFPYYVQASGKEVDPFMEYGNFNKRFVMINSKYFLPSSQIDSLLGNRVNMKIKRGFSESYDLHPNNFITHTQVDLTRKNILLRNKQTEDIARVIGIPVVDLYSIYKRIHAGSYISLDGVPVKVEDFYSSDNFFPSAFGQAVVTNETIKVINEYYGLNIPYIDSRAFLR